MPIIKQKTQVGGIDEESVQCYCGENSYISVKRWDDEYIVYITQSPTSLRERLRLAWAALRGLEFHYSNEVLLSQEQLDEFMGGLLRITARKDAK